MDDFPVKKSTRPTADDLADVAASVVLYSGRLSFAQVKAIILEQIHNAIALDRIARKDEEPPAAVAKRLAAEVANFMREIEEREAANR